MVSPQVVVGLSETWRTSEQACYAWMTAHFGNRPRTAPVNYRYCRISLRRGPRRYYCPNRSHSTVLRLDVHLDCFLRPFSRSEHDAFAWPSGMRSKEMPGRS